MLFHVQAKWKMKFRITALIENNVNLDIYNNFLNFQK